MNAVLIASSISTIFASQSFAAGPPLKSKMDVTFATYGVRELKLDRYRPDHDKVP